jgi:hypothetical protein
MTEITKGTKQLYATSCEVELDTAELVIRRGEEAADATSTPPRTRLKGNSGRGKTHTRLVALATLSRRARRAREGDNPHGSRAKRGPRTGSGLGG